MKKLTLILSTILLMSSTAAFAKRKAANLNVNMGNLSNCLHAKQGLEAIADAEKGVNFVGKCEGQKLVGKIILSYRRRAAQSFKLEYGKWGLDGYRQETKSMSKALGMIPSITTEYDEELGFEGSRYFIKGKISLR